MFQAVGKPRVKIKIYIGPRELCRTQTRQSKQTSQPF